MPIDPDAFRHHPGLVGRIRAPEDSFYRTMMPADLDARMAERGIGPDWRRTDADREATRHAVLADRFDDDIWVFAYGSLMWDPALCFSEVRRARIDGWARRMCLVDRLGGRGTEEAPGIMAALDRGPACNGLAFRIPAGIADRETEILWRREMISHAYIPRFLPAFTDHGPIQVLAFVADHDAEMIEPDISRAEQVRCLRRGVGFLGTSLEYLENMLGNLHALDIPDPELESLLAEAEAD